MGIEELHESLRARLSFNMKPLRKHEVQNSGREFEALLSEFENRLRSETGIQTLRKIVDRNREDLEMPIGTMFKVYQRLIELTPKEASVLLDFAEYLRLFGPDWAEEAQMIVDHIERGEYDKAFDIGMKVDYDKYN